MVLFLVMNASSVTLVPDLDHDVPCPARREESGRRVRTDPDRDVHQRSRAACLIVAAIQKLNLWNRVVLAWLGGLTLAVAGLVWYFAQPRSPRRCRCQSGILANAVLIGLISAFLIAGAVRRLPLYETFIEGAKEGFGVAIGIVPYLVAILVAVGALRASGALEAFLDAIKGGRRPPEHRHAMGRRPADRAHQAALGRRCARHDGRHDEGAGTRLVRRPAVRA
jgi:hypothetical protein